MKRIGLAGIAGSASIEVRSQGEHAGLIGRLTETPQAVPSAAYVLDSTTERLCTPISVTASGGWNGASFGAGFVPGVLSNFSTVRDVIGDRVVLSGLDYYTSYAPAMFEGGEVEFRRITDGRMVHVGTAGMADVAFPLKKVFPSATKQVIKKNRFRHKLDSWNRRGVSYWYSVAAVDALGAIGAWSDWVSYVAQDVADATVVTGNITAEIPSRAEGGVLVAPTGVTLAVVGGVTVDLSWSVVDGAAGYAVCLAYSDPATWPDTVGEFRLTDLVGGMPQAGDMVIWRKEVMRLTADMLCSRTYGVTGTRLGLYPGFVEKGLVTDDATPAWEIRSWQEGEKPSPNLGRYYLHQTVPPATRAVSGIYWSGGTGQSYYHHKKKGETLRVDLWIRASAPVRMRFNSGQPGETSQSFDVGTEWRQYHLVSDYASEPEGAKPYKWAIAVTSGDAALTVEYAQLRAYLGGIDYGALRPYLSDSLVPGQKIRDHSLIKTCPKTYTAKIITNPPGEGFDGQTCGMHMDICRTHQATPWVQLEWALFKEDWLIWAEWIATNHADFDKIMLELGNENWNTLSAFWTMPSLKDAATGTTLSAAAVYGLMTQMVYEWLQESPHWPVLKDRIEMVIGGRLINGFGEQAYARCPAAKYVTVANYNGGWDNGTEKRDETGTSFGNMLGFAGGAERLAVREAALATVAATRGHVVGQDVFHDIYEAGPGYQLNGLNGASMTADEVIVQECVMKSRAAATAQLDAICTAWKRGWLSNWFVLGRGDYFTSHNNDGVEYLTHAVGRLVGASMGEEFRIHDIHPLAMVTQDGQDEIAMHAFESLSYPGKWVFAALNRAIDRTVLEPADPLYDAADQGMRAVTLHTGFATATGCRVFRGGLGSMRAHNRYPVGTRLTAEGTYQADPLCMKFDMDWHDTALPADIGQLQIDATLGVETDGLLGGNFILVEFTGLSRE